MIRHYYTFGLICALLTQSVQALEIETWETDNGVPVLFVESHDLPIVDIRLSFRAASSRDGDLPGISSLVNGLLVEGTGDLSAQDIALGFEQVGARSGHLSYRDLAWVGLRSLSDTGKLDGVIDLLARMTALPSFPKDALERDRDGMLANLAQRETDIGDITSDRFFYSIYQGHPYQSGSRGTAESLKRIKRDDLFKFHSQYYVARNATLAITGDLTVAQARHYANRVTQHLQPGKRASALPLASKHEPKTIRIPFDATQTHVMMGLPVLSLQDPDFYVLIVGNHILGGSGAASRLTEAIRENRGLAYSVYSYFLPLESQGPFIMGLQTRNQNANQAIALLQKTFEDFVQQGPSERELELAKNNISGGFALNFDSNRKILNQLTTIGFNQLPLDYLEQYNRHIQSVSAEDIRRVFQNRVKLQNMVRVIVGKPQTLSE